VTLPWFTAERDLDRASPLRFACSTGRCRSSQTDPHKGRFLHDRYGIQADQRVICLLSSKQHRGRRCL